jgi:hypothetical protein
MLLFGIWIGGNMSAECTVASVYYGSQEWKTVNGRWYVKMFGTSGPGQSPHWFWGEVAQDRVPAPVRKALES